MSTYNSNSYHIDVTKVKWFGMFTVTVQTCLLAPILHFFNVKFSLSFLKMKKAIKKWFRGWCFFCFVCCCSTNETKTRTRNGRKQWKNKETEFIEFTDLGKNTSVNGSCKRSGTTKKEAPETLKNDTPTSTSSKISNNTLNKESPGHLSVEDCKAQPFYPTNHSPQKENPLILQSGPLLDCTADHWPYFPPNLLPPPPLEQKNNHDWDLWRSRSAPAWSVHGRCL